jgi:hypothetical protein
MFKHKGAKFAKKKLITDTKVLIVFINMVHINVATIQNKAT